MTIVSSAQANRPIQMAEEGQANPEESQRIRKVRAELPAVEVKSVDSINDAPHRVACRVMASGLAEGNALGVDLDAAGRG